MRFFVSGSICSHVMIYGRCQPPICATIRKTQAGCLPAARLSAVVLRSVTISPPIFPVVSHGPCAPNGFAFRRSFPVLMSVNLCWSTDSIICIIPYLIMNIVKSSVDGIQRTNFPVQIVCNWTCSKNNSFYLLESIGFRGH